MPDDFGVGSINDKYVHAYGCGGALKMTGTCVIVSTDIPEWICLKCHDAFDSSDYDEFESVNDNAHNM